MKLFRSCVSVTAATAKLTFSARCRSLWSTNSILQLDMIGVEVVTKPRSAPLPCGPKCSANHSERLGKSVFCYIITSREKFQVPSYRISGSR
ncbi:hypothetical protein BT63DRAFT_189924 [Microthyrium microscopicum]|uniref:Uncharacterized protein n=1 Tax=Microthyrium microscopicum TaxID=703497 RepID=A0A6A6UML8_9PEZI|nr:hypothetical protein BT63DRAFT_189924 [Microthyrium microscopicum]